MAFDLSHLILGGQISNVRSNVTAGVLYLRGMRLPIGLELTGDCGKSLRGKWLTFTLKHRIRDEAPMASIRDALLKMHLGQIGPTRRITLQHEGHSHATLRLEWDGQQGRVTAVLRNIEILAMDRGPVQQIDAREFARITGRRDGDEVSLIDNNPFQSCGDDADGAMPGDVFDVDDFDAGGLGDLPSEMMDDEDPYGLLPADLKASFDLAAYETDASLHVDAPTSDPVDPIDLDAAFDEGDEEDDEDFDDEELFVDEADIPGERVADLIEGRLTLPRPDSLANDRDAERPLKKLLAAIAKQNIALEMCEHATALSAYRYLVNEICLQEYVPLNQKTSVYSLHFSTSDACPQCEEQMKRDAEQWKRQRGRRGPHLDDDDIPF